MVHPRADENLKMMVIVSYLVSYEHMGMACIWMDTRHNASECNEREEIEYQIVDGLMSEHQSVSKVISWQLEGPSTHVYLHALIIDTERPSLPRNGTDGHKFKIINFKAFQM